MRRIVQGNDCKGGKIDQIKPKGVLGCVVKASFLGRAADRGVAKSQ